MTPSMPDGYLSRPAVREDADALLALVNAYMVAVTGAPDYALDDVLEDLDDPDLDLERDTRIVIAPDRRMVAYACVWSSGRPALPIIELVLHPDEWAAHPGIDPALLAWAEARVRANEAEIPADVRLAMRAFSDARDERLRAVLIAAGFAAFRHGFKMGIPLDAPLEPARMPDGFALRIVEQDDDPVPVFDAFRDAWRDHFGYIEGPYEQRLESFRHYWAQNFSPGLWLLAMDGDTVAGMSLCQPKRGPDTTQGFISIVGVRRAYRRRGVAEALLRLSFHALQAAGKASASLYVDGESLTGATRLYERAGMFVWERHTQYEKELRPGVDPSTREAGA